MPARRPPAPLDPRGARRAAAELLGRRPWTAAELARRLERRGAPPEVAAGVVAELTARGHLDDAAFARLWVETRAGRGYGPARLRAALRARGVAPALVEAALGAVAPETALERARALARRYLPALRRARAERRPARLAAYLLRRGYGGEVVARVVAECLGAPRR